jgi:hypothetical protein
MRILVRERFLEVSTPGGVGYVGYKIPPTAAFGLMRHTNASEIVLKTDRKYPGEKK